MALDANTSPPAQLLNADGTPRINEEDFEKTQAYQVIPQHRGGFPCYRRARRPPPKLTVNVFAVLPCRCIVQRERTNFGFVSDTFGMAQAMAMLFASPFLWAATVPVVSVPCSSPTQPNRPPPPTHTHPHTLHAVRRRWLSAGTLSRCRPLQLLLARPLYEAVEFEICRAITFQVKGLLSALPQQRACRTLLLRRLSAPAPRGKRADDNVGRFRIGRTTPRILPSVSGPALRSALVCTYKTFTNGRSIFSRSTENGPAFP